MRKAHNRVDISGRIFTRLTALEDVGANKYGNRLWKCRCDCGKEVVTTAARLLGSQTKSCGCLNTDRITKHGMHKSDEYRIWSVMKQRCLKQGNSNYYRYGGRGVTVCDRWVQSFEAFFADMGPRPSKDWTLDRIDNTKGYSPENCRWTTWDVQYRNRSTNTWLEYNGVKKCITDLAAEHSIDTATLSQRLERGWDMYTALNAPAYYQYYRKGPMLKEGV